MDLSDLIARNADFTPDKTAIRFGSCTLSYADFHQRIAQTARALKSELGVGRGDRVAILAANHSDYLVTLYACARLGAMLVTLNWRLAVPEQLFILSDSGAKVLIVDKEFSAVVAQLAQHLPDIKVVGLDYTPDDAPSFDALLAAGTGDGRNPHTDISNPLLLVYTSGTTGRPKGAVLRQEALVWNALMSHHAHDMRSDDHILTYLPLFHVGGLNIQTTPALQLGATVTVHQRFAPDTTLQAVGKERPTLMLTVPAVMQALSQHPLWGMTDLSSLRAVAAGSSLIPVPLIEAFMTRGIPVIQIYGSTETGPTAVYTRVGGDLSRLTSTGLPGLYCEAKVVDNDGREVPHGTAGEVVVRGPNVLYEYWGNAEATADALRDGWYHTGDIGTRDADGYFYIHDRKKNMIISGGENIYPAEIERVLHDHPCVAEAAVIGRPDPKWQEVPVAYIVCRRDMTVTADEVKEFVGRNLARFKIPREIVFVDSLPRTALGKVQHFMLREQQ
ncbi:long-chain-fatty-acid--CoA ligase [Pseudorhodoplanes sp.]|uniref:long-chain-fatty-acid--CoA ligase n=1 Tax=Pseudorhodoplanes sp. TaxID=1934341 RepID=UPI00391B79E6